MKQFLTIFFISIIGFLTVSGQDSLSIEQAITLGLENNFQVQISSREADIAANNNSWGAAGAFPTLQLGAQLAGTNSASSTYEDLPAPNNYSSAQYTYLQPKVDLNWVIFNGFKIKVTKAKLADIQAQSDGNAAILIENTLQSTILAYYLANLQYEALQVSEEVLELSRDRYNYVLTKKQFGSAVTFDVLQAKSNYLTDSSNVLRQQLNYDNALRNLNQVLAEPIDKKYNLSSEFDLDKNIHDFELLDLITKLESNNKTLQNQYIYQEILKKNTRINQSQFYPMLSLNAGANLDYSNDFIDFNNRQYSNGHGGYANLSLTWTLSNGGNVRRAVQNAKIQEEIGELKLEEMRRAMHNQLFTALADYNIKRQLRQVSLLSVESASLNMQIAEERFKSGAINSFNYRDIQIIYFNAARELLQSNYNLVESYTELLRLTGGIVSDFGGE